MATFSLETVQQIPTDPENAWSFFSDPHNLESLTPPGLKFRVISKQQGSNVYPGQIIEYYVSPLWGIPLYWMTEITHVQDRVFFVDEQRFGPYQFWHHQHHFRPIEGGVEMTDIVHYRNVFGFIGNIANALFVHAQLRKIFEFRFKKIEDQFGKWDDTVQSMIFRRSDRSSFPS